MVDTWQTVEAFKPLLFSFRQDSVTSPNSTPLPSQFWLRSLTEFIVRGLIYQDSDMRNQTHKGKGRKKIQYSRQKFQPKIFGNIFFSSIVINKRQSPNLVFKLNKRHFTYDYSVRVIFLVWLWHTSQGWRVSDRDDASRQWCIFLLLWLLLLFFFRWILLC